MRQNVSETINYAKCLIGKFRFRDILHVTSQLVVKSKLKKKRDLVMCQEMRFVTLTC
jgi:hypothetical protein